MTKTAAILLAAGRSSRMGQLKALLSWKGVPLIQYQIEQMKLAKIDEIIVVLGYHSEQLKRTISMYEVKVVENDSFDEGKSSSIRKGVQSLRRKPQGIFISAVDQPVPSGVLAEMVKHLKHTEAAAVIPTFNKKSGHPILFHGSMKNELMLVNEETMGLRSIIHKFQKQITYLDVNDSAILLNFNRPEDYYSRRGGSK
ncbi:4-diphosphocytidyl-2C-methyl-D-erythritol synthase [Bacillus freudenreichii]|nr:4-diphosphocytidyl-2C-methyl-D-erythritol synthase [Bacillus freudenreichii]